MGAVFTDDWISRAILVTDPSEGPSENHLLNKIINQTVGLSEVDAAESNDGVLQLKMAASDELDDTIACEEYPDSSSKPAGERVVLNRRVRALHPGKAGGGTMVAEIRNAWNVSVKICHPRPCVEKTYELLEQSNRNVAMILIRDPVDRFLSAFYWRQLIQCDPNGDSREEVRGARSKLAEQTDKYCRPAPKGEEATVLFSDRYNRDAEEVARALCSSDSTVAEQASADMKQIAHSMWSISDWVGPDWTNYAESIYPIVLEHDFDFLEQVDDALSWVYYDIAPFETEERFLERRASVRQRRACELSAKAATSKASDHSSGSIKQTLSEYGRQCIARYYAADYNILGELRDSSCKSDVCRNAIKSILDRKPI